MKQNDTSLVETNQKAASCMEWSFWTGNDLYCQKKESWNESEDCYESSHRLPNKHLKISWENMILDYRLSNKVPRVEFLNLFFNRVHWAVCVSLKARQRLRVKKAVQTATALCGQSLASSMSRVQVKYQSILIVTIFKLVTLQFRFADCSHLSRGAQWPCSDSIFEIHHSIGRMWVKGEVHMRRRRAKKIHTYLKRVAIWLMTWMDWYAPWCIATHTPTRSQVQYLGTSYVNAGKAPGSWGTKTQWLLWCNPNVTKSYYFCKLARHVMNHKLIR